jgi:hypothetical protein
MQIEEGTLTIPREWHDATVNIFTEKQPGARGVSVTVNRDRLPAGSTLDEYVEEQSERLKTQLKGFQLVGKERIMLGRSPAYLLEFTWQSRDVGEIHQLLMTALEEYKVLNFAGTSPGKMDGTQCAQLRAILQSFRPNLPDPR